MMKVWRFLLLISLSYGSGQRVQADETPVDPIFNIAIPGKVYNTFEARGAKALLARCTRAANSFGSDRGVAHVFAQIDRGSLWLVIADLNGRQGLISVRDGRCVLEAPQLVLAGDSKRVPLSDEEMEALFLDAFKRYALAFGGKEKFLTWLDSNMNEAERNCKGKGQPKWMCSSGYADFLPSQLRALKTFRASDEP